MNGIISAILASCFLFCVSGQPQPVQDAPQVEETAYIEEVAEDYPPEVCEDPQEDEKIEAAVLAQCHRIDDCELTAYCWTGNPTATGVYPEEGVTVAVDPNVIPLGSWVIINGNWYIAQDTGGVIKGNIIDIYFGHDEDAAIQFGRQHATVYWMEP